MQIPCKSIGCEYSTQLNYDFCFTCTQASHSPKEFDDSLEKTEADPNGLDQHAPGAKVDAGKTRMGLITGGMARAIMDVAKVGTMGAAKYSDGGWVSVPDGFRRYEDAQQRHATYRHIGEIRDSESGLLHLAHEAWNALAKLDLYIRQQENPGTNQQT